MASFQHLSLVHTCKIPTITSMKHLNNKGKDKGMLVCTCSISSHTWHSFICSFVILNVFFIPVLILISGKDNIQNN